MPGSGQHKRIHHSPSQSDGLLHVQKIRIHYFSAVSNWRHSHKPSHYDSLITQRMWHLALSFVIKSLKMHLQQSAERQWLDPFIGQYHYVKTESEIISSCFNNTAACRVCVKLFRETISQKHNKLMEMYEEVEFWNTYGQLNEIMRAGNGFRPSSTEREIAILWMTGRSPHTTQSEWNVPTGSTECHQRPSSQM